MKSTGLAGFLGWLGALGLAAMVAQRSCAADTNDVLYSIVTNPAEDTSTQMNIGWHANTNCTNCFVTYTTKSDNAWAQAAKATGTGTFCDLFKGISSKTASGADYYEEAVFLDYGVTLSSLKSDTEYMYEVCASDGARSEPHFFRTAGATEFSFVWIGDFHCYPPLAGRLRNAVKVLHAAVAVDPGVSFVFSTGDVVAWGGSYSFWKTMYEQDFIRNYMFANVLGNHDAMTRTRATSADFFRTVNHFPRNGYAGQEGVCYWFLYGNALFITLNNEAMAGNPAAQQAAKAWAAGVIDHLKGKYRFIFLGEHYQWFDGRHGAANWYNNWKGFCDEHRVALALSGNNHIYERSQPLCQDQVVAEGEGTVYMEVPSSDGDRGVEAGALTQNAEKLACTYSSHVCSNNGEVKTIGCVLVHVTASKIATKLVYIDENQAAHVADEHDARALPALPAR